jgi:AcrR family transcriptional regulator
VAAQPETVRRRRRPEEAEREILEAADRLLREEPFHRTSVDAIMRQTTLSRNSFYAYFPDRYALLTRLFEPVAAKLHEAHALFLQGAGDLLSDGREAMLRVASIFAEDGALFRAVYEASAYDADAHRLWRELNDPVVEDFAGKIREEIRAGNMVEVEPEATARALLAMDIHCFLDQLVDDPRADIERLVDVLVTVWARTLLVREPSLPPHRRAASGSGAASG